MARSVIAFSLALLLAVFDLGTCLKCYQCNSQSDATCADPFSTTKNLVDCNDARSKNYNQEYLRTILPADLIHGIVGAPRYCHKIVMMNGATIRTCLDANPNDLNQTCRQLDNIAKAVPMELIKQVKHCSVCDKDNCNGVGNISASLSFALVGAIVAFFFRKQ